MTILITRGLPASGKSTWSKAWVDGDPERRARVCRDDIREMIASRGGVLAPWQESVVSDIEVAGVRAAIRAGKSVVVDAMHLRAKYVRKWADLASEMGVEIQLIGFDIHPDQAVARDALRPKPVGESVIRDLARRLTDNGVPRDVDFGASTVPNFDRYEPDPNKPGAIIVDIDGTVAHMAGRSPYEWHRVGEDEPDELVVDMVQTYELLGFRIIFVSGRDEGCRKVTEDWLNWHVVENYDLYMRPAGDTRQDAIVKRELFDEYIRNSYDVRFVLDDRNSVVKMWRSLGLKCLQVQEGDF